MKAAALFLSCVVLGIQAAQEPIPSLTIGTNTYLNATIRKRNGFEVIVKFDGGLAMVKSKELPEPYRTTFYDADAERKSESKELEAKRLQDEDQKAKAISFSETFMRELKPLRVINGKLYDFSLVLQSKRVAPWTDDYVLRGKVAQVLQDGLLVTTKSGSAFLVNSRRSGSVIDGSTVSDLSLLVGRYQYINTLGAQTTIPKYDAGIIYDRKSNKFLTVTRLTESGEIEIPMVLLPPAK